MSDYLSIPPTYKTSKADDKLMSHETPAGPVEFFEHDFGSYKLEARILYNQAKNRPWVMMVHGARSDFSRADPIVIGLQGLGISLLTFNLSGHSEASGVPEGDTNLGNNIKEALEFYRYLDPAKPKAILAISLGGTPALKVLGEHPEEVNRIVLMGPGIYSKFSYDKNYGQGFREVISQPFSYRDNDTVENLKSYKGKLLVIKGEYDGLDPVDFGKPAGTSAGEVHINGKTYYSPIPKEVVEMVYGAVQESQRQMIEVPGCDHLTASWLQSPEQGSKLLATIADFIKG